MGDSNLVPMPPRGLLVALQYWEGDEKKAFRLARLLADIEAKPRQDVTIAFVRRFDIEHVSQELWDTQLYVGAKFPTMAMRARREGVGHPHGCNELWSSCLEQFSEAWRAGNLPSHSIFTMEADGVPLRVDWIYRLLQAHQRTLDAGLRITGPLMQEYPHINGSVIAHCSLWFDRPSLHQTPKDQGWDLYHAQVILAEGRGDPWIKNVYGQCDWSAASLFAMSHETAWLSSQKDESSLVWAEKTLVATAKTRRARNRGCACPDVYHCKVDACQCGCWQCRRLPRPLPSRK